MQLTDIINNVNAGMAELAHMRLCQSYLMVI